MKSLKFFKPALATTLAIVLGWLLSVRPAEAGYTVTLQQVGPDVVATGSGAINLTGLTFDGHRAGPIQSQDTTSRRGGRVCRGHCHGADFFQRGLLRRGHWTDEFRERWLNACQQWQRRHGRDRQLNFGTRGEHALIVPRGYVSGTFLSNSATYSGKTLATLGVTPGTYVWTWGSGANQNFTLQIPVPPPNWASDRHHQSRNLDRKLFSQTEWLGQSARIDHQRVFSIWNNDQLRTHYRSAQSHWKHFPRCQCEY